MVERSLAMVPLLGATLLIQSFARLQQEEPGFRAENLLTAHVWLPEAKCPKPALRAAFFSGLVERVAAIPGVQSAAAGTMIPMIGGDSGTNIAIEGRPAPPAGQQLFALNALLR